MLSTAEAMADSRLALAEHQSTSTEAELALAIQADSAADLATHTDPHTLLLFIAVAVSTAADFTEAAESTDDHTAASTMPRLAIDLTATTAAVAVAVTIDNEAD